MKTAALKILIAGAGVLAIAAVCGTVYEQAQRAEDEKRFPRTGRSVDIGGRTLNLYCSGSGGPSIILQSGATWPLYREPKAMFEKGAPRPGSIWMAVQRELAQFTTACWYDRAGAGWSEPGPYPRDSASQARDLHALLKQAGVPGPYVLVAESSAALDARVYAGLYPDDVAGMALVNGVHPDTLLRSRPGSGKLAGVREFAGYSQDVAARIFDRTGLYRFGLPKRPAPGPPPEGMTAAEWDTVWRLTQGPRARAALLQEIAAWERSTAEARAAGSLGSRPLAVVCSDDGAAGANGSGVWMELQTDLAGLSSRGKLIAIDESGDPVYRAPGAIAAAVRQVAADALRYK